MMPVDHVKYLGMYLDKYLSWYHHPVGQKVYYQNLVIMYHLILASLLGYFQFTSDLWLQYLGPYLGG